MGRALQGASQSRNTPEHSILITTYLRGGNLLDPSTLEEVCTAIRQLRNNRAPGEGGIPAEVYNTCLDCLGPWLHRVITKIWLCETVPNNWSEAVLLPLFKKGDKQICSNYRELDHVN